MKFTISSSVLSSNLQSIGKVISNKNTLPILDYFLFEMSDDKLNITASDLETTLYTTLDIDNLDEPGSVAIPARRITDSIKEFSEQPLTIEVDKESWEVTISWKTGKLSIPGITGLGYPEQQALDAAGTTSVSLTSGLLNEGITRTIFATADDQLRPVMNGISIGFSPDEITFVATDAHRLVRFIDNSIKSENTASFILPSKPAMLLKNILPRDAEEKVEVSFDSKNVIFTLPRHRLICRLIEGNYPNYNAVIPKDNPNKLVIDRNELMGSIKRVAVCANQASGLIKFNIADGNLNITAQDLDYSASAEDNLACDYAADAIEIGFKSPFLLDILSNINSQEVVIELADATRPGIFLPVDKNEESQSLLMLLMPMMINV